MRNLMQPRTAPRKVALGDYLPPVLARVRELNVAAAAQSPALQAAWDTVYALFDEQYLHTACDVGLVRWEKILGILPSTADSLEQRRTRILLRINEHLPFTLHRLKQMLEMLTGVGGYTIVLDENTYTLDVGLALAVKRRLVEIQALLARVVPANMVARVLLQYNTHRQLSNISHRKLQKSSHYELKEEVLK